MSVSARRVIIVGAGGHARVVASILLWMRDVDVVGVADRTKATLGETVGFTRIVTTIDELPALRREGVTWAALAIGDNRERAALFSRLEAEGFSLLTARHPTAIIERDVGLGAGSMVCAGAILCAGVSVGPDVLLNTGAIVDHESRIGAHAHIGPGCRISGRVAIGERTFVGAGTTIRDHVTIGADSVIGVGSVIVDDIPDGVVAYGVPARVQRRA